MNLGKVSFGLVVIFFGVFILLENLGVLNFNWFSIFDFWPVLIILIGVNILLPKKTEGQILSIMATVIVLLFFTYQGLKPTRATWRISQNKDVVNDEAQLSLLSRDYDEKVDHAELNISGGAVEFKISDTSDKLIDIEANSTFSSFALSSILNNGKATLDFTQKDTDGRKVKSLGKANRALIHLNQNPIWDINLEIGASTADFDLKPFKVRKLKIEGGASSIKVVLGMPVEESSKIDFEGGVSSLKLQIPKEAGCIIYAEAGLSSLKFSGFVKQEDGTYLSENYKESPKRIEIKLENGLSSIEVSRY